MNNISFRDAEMACSEKLGNGAAYHPTGKTQTLPWKPDSPVTYISDTKEKQTPSKGIAHVRACALKATHPEGTANEPIPKDYFCYGQNFYDVVVDDQGRIAAMTELYGS